MPTRWFSGAHAIHARRERQDPLAVKDSQAQDIQVTGRDSGFDRVSILSSARQRRVGRPAETRTALKDWADYLTRSQRACNAGFDPTLLTLEKKYHLRVNPGFKIDSPLL